MSGSRRIVKKIMLGAGLLAVTAALLGAGGGYYLLRRAQPDYRGQVAMPGLSAKVDIFRDAYGVPHIFAANDKDAARALGYVHAGERLFQMEMQRRAGQGRLSEITGAQTLGIDQFVRTLGLYGLAQSSFAAMSPDAQGVFQAYADGVNDWLDTHRDRLPPEFLILRDNPEPWRPADSVVWGKLMALELSKNYRLEMLRAKLSATLSPKKIRWVLPMPPADTPITTKPDATAQVENRADDRLAALLGLGHAASNEWVVGGSRTVSGKPMLANDPHLDLEAPILWYLARIVTPQDDMRGATVPGLPLVLLGQNAHVAWGFTTTGSDTQDLFVETVDPADPQRYLTPLGSEPFTTHNEIIHVKGGADVNMMVRATRHGPVLSDIDGDMAALAGAGHVMALAFTGLGDRDTTSEALLRVDHAHDAGALRDALKLYQTPAQNIVYADDAGAFGFINPGLVPIRKHGDGLIPADGASGADDWEGMIPFDHLPQVENPAAGYIFNANNAVVGADAGDYFGQDWEEDYRARRLRQFFASDEPFTLARSAAMQADHVSLAAVDLLPLLLAISPQDQRMRQALDLLRGWNGEMDRDRPEPVIFAAWLDQFHRHMLIDKTRSDLREQGPFAATTLATLVRYHAPEWCGDADCHDIIAQSLAEALAAEARRQGQDMASWRWGRENIAMLRHKFYRHIPVLDRLSDLSVGGGGDFYTLDRGGGFDNDADHPFARTHGGGFRGIYDLGDRDASRFVIATGESGHILSSHYGDLTPLWIAGQSITLSGSADALKQRGADLLVLMP